MASIRNITEEELLRNRESLENIASSSLLTGVEIEEMVFFGV